MIETAIETVIETAAETVIEIETEVEIKIETETAIETETTKIRIETAKRIVAVLLSVVSAALHAAEAPHLVVMTRSAMTVAPLLLLRPLVTALPHLYAMETSLAPHPLRETAAPQKRRALAPVPLTPSPSSFHDASNAPPP